MNLTIYFIVGGNDTYYENVGRAIASLKNLKTKPEIVIFDMQNRLSSNNQYRVQQIPPVNGGYQFWREKHVRALEIETEYGLYLDNDMVMVQDRLEHFCAKIGNGIGTCNHYWVKDVRTYRERAISPAHYAQFDSVCEYCGLSANDKIYTGGAFIFHNNTRIRRIFQKVINDFDRYPTYVNEITDEIYFSAASKYEMVELSGAFNHCCSPDMRLEMREGCLWGGNAFDAQTEPVAFLHCDVSRRDPRAPYHGEMRTLVADAFSFN